MQVILTHEQADFDALGSLLAATLLENHRSDKPAFAIKPRRANRNAFAFLTLYGNELPFIDLHELPTEPVEQILLVDTQSLITLKGVGPHTRVSVIDHHLLRPDLPADWSVAHEPTGACTTLLVEQLKVHNLPLNVIQTTIMLLGIYEDTGSLSYNHTTSRDALAAAFLLEKGANLQILSEFLNPPLSPEQRQLFEKLVTNAESRTIHGHNIIISMADAKEMSDEISSIAHKMRDLLEPDAIFLLVYTSEGIRLVARSTTDLINVAAIAAEFNGGGHARASAALIKPASVPGVEPNHNPLEQVYRQLIDILPGYVYPPVMISQIMSRDPHTISPKTSAQEAAQLMQRYGYEGFPVVQDEKLIGLLTRRAVDRANSHKININAERLMESGVVSVCPGDSIDHLQEIMVSSGWGQIPVIDLETHKVIGIVTRTDLIKTLTNQAISPSQQNLAGKLETVLPSPRMRILKMTSEKTHKLHFALYIVGGFVRDLLLDHPSQDFDLVVEGDAIALGKALASEYGGRVVFHKRFGTAKWQPPDTSESLDLITARTEYYEHPTALPTVESGNIKLDLNRRDFTINTLAIRLDGKHYGELHDYWGGLNDLRQRLIRVLHSLSFIDDPTRLLRAVRFEQRFGFTIEPRTLQLMEEACPLLNQVSGDRLRHELDLILIEEKAVNMLTRLEELGILNGIHPDLHWHGENANQFPGIISNDVISSLGYLENTQETAIRSRVSYLIWLSDLSSDKARLIAERLRFSGSLTDALLSFLAVLPDLPNLERAKPSQIVDRLEFLPIMAIYAAYLVIRSDLLKQTLWTYITTWRHVKPTINGENLLARGLSPSPVFRMILKSLRDAWLDQEINSTSDEETLLEKLLCNQPPGSLI
jgi:tRNA nucleotidyltransferase (CCA-adding enzyme)